MMKKIEEFNNLIKEAILEKAIPGANYAIVFKDHVIIDSLGYKSLEPNVELNDVNTIYDLASLTKIVATTSCALHLLERGKLRLYAPVKKYLSNFKYDQITIWHLMTHTSGLPEGIPYLGGFSSREDVLQRLENVSLKYETGTKINYSDVGYIILGQVIEAIVKMPLDKYAKSEIFDKLDMKNTMYNPSFSTNIAPTEKRGEDVVRGVVHDETAAGLGGVSGNAGVFSTISDMANFVSMLLNQGVYKGKQFLAKQTIDLLYTPQVCEFEGNSLISEQRSIGFVIRGASSSAGVLTSKNTILHTGFTGTNLFVDRDNEVGFVLLTNRVHPSRQNKLHMDLRARLANFIIANLEDLKNNR